MGVAFILGVMAGLFVGEPIMIIEPLGTLFLNLLQMIVIPIIIFTLIMAMRKLDPSTLGQVGIQTVLVYMITTTIAITIGLTSANFLNPGVGLSLPEEAEIQTEEAPGLVEVLIDIVPTNIFEALSEADILSILFFVIIFGLALTFLRSSSNNEVKKGVEVIFNFAEAGAYAMFKIVWGIMEYGVIGVFALLATTFAETGFEALTSFALLVLTLAIAVIVHITFIYLFVITRILANKSPLAFLRGSKDAILTAFATRSSGGTLPISMKNAGDDLKIDESIYGFTLPLGSTINMDGSAMYLGVTAIFAANLIGQTLSLSEQLTIVITTVLASIGTAGVPGAGVIMLTMILTQLGLPLGVVAFVAGVDPILDGLRTLNNVTGDLSVTTLIAKWHGGIDFDQGVWKYK
ncbi:dicarboxylate/amino acid:cation symporter [Natranaerofaba carboxydovora]|uniref:dicarboxylate/amino acid:cation symporter n=1 Tax=Natranaerofaba carboxydovora TaxID=2742683 RepID=UPI003B8489A6